MNTERWHQISELFHAVLERDREGRAAFLADACREDAELRREVQAMLDGHTGAGSFGEHPLSASMEPDQEMRLAPGHRLGPYEILGALGVGGMGEVYRAHDTRLGRDVAIKILPRRFADNTEWLNRFRREARLLASLNHPNIAAIYGLEKAGDIDYLILELVNGEILTAPLPLDTVLDYGHQIAEGLEAAHSSGIIHRDLKPANVKVTPDGKAKLLDFGLAKAVWGVEENADLSRELSTRAELETLAGHIVGSPSYMSPEQARGQRVDERTMCWAIRVFPLRVSDRETGVSRRDGRRHD